MRVFFRVALKIKCLVSILGRQPSLVNANFLDCSNIALIKASLVERKRHTNMRLCEIASQRVNIGCPMTLFSSGRRTKIQTNQQHGNLVSDVTTASLEFTSPPGAFYCCYSLQNGWTAYHQLLTILQKVKPNSHCV